VDVTCARDVEVFIRSCPDSQAVVFAAGYTRERAISDPDSARLVAERGIEHVLTAARAAGIPRAVVVSSLSVYGNAGGGDRLSVDGPTRPLTSYGRIQLDLEARARAFARDLDVAVLRVAGVFGPKRVGQGSRSSRLVERVLYGAAAGDPVRIEGCWEDEDDLIYVKDAGEAIGAAALTHGIGSVTVNVGLGRVTTLREIADAVLAVFPTADIAVTPPPQPREPTRRLPIDSAGLVARLGVRPAFPLTAAIRDYAIETELIRAG